ncbi:Hypothetical protein J6896_01027 [Nakaseomyces glabratus]
MKYLSVFATFVAILSWACATVYPNFYKDKTIVLDGMGTEEFTIPRDKILSLVNTSLTLKNFAHISIKEGVLIQEKSSVTIIPPIGASRKFNFTLGGVFDLENESKFIFDGSGNTYEDEADAVNNFVFDIYANSSGIQVYKGNTVSVTLPTIKNSIPNYQGESPHIRFAGSTLDQFIYKPPYVLVSLMIIAGKFEVLSPGSKTGSQFDKVIWRVDFGVSGLAKTNPNTPSYGVDKLTGEITCEGILAVYNDMFAFTNNAVLHTLGYIGYSVVSPITLDLSMGPIRRPTNYEYLVALPAGQDGITLTGYKYTADTDISDAHQYLFYYFYDNDATKEDEISVSTDNSDVRILHSNPSQTVTVHGDSALNIGYYKGDRIDSFVGFDGLDFSKYKKELAVYFYESFQYSSTTTTKSDEYTTEIIEIIVSGTLGIDNKPSPVTISSTIYNQLRETTETVDLGNGVTEYHVLDYFPAPQDDKEHPYGTSTKIITYSPPPVTITATTAADYVETDWISFFITTNDKGEIITDSTLFNATRDYNLPEAPHTSFGPAPPAETKTVDLGNEVTEYLVISYWTTTNEFGGLITTSSTRTYSPPPVTITATTAADYVETDWISFFITTNDKGEIITDSTLFNATRDYNLPEAPHTSFGPAPPAETKTVDLGNEVTEYLVISYWTTTNEFGGLITTSSTRTVRLLLTAHCSMLRVTTTCLRLRTSFGPAPPAETKTVDLGNEVTEYLVISYWTTTNEFGGLITTSSTRTYSPPPVTITATTAADYVETDWISFFITTNDKGEIITDSTLFNATRDYNLPEAPHTSFGPAPPAETKTVDLGNEVTEYLVISYWTTTNEFGGLITTSSTRTYSPPPVTITATTAADYVETDWISFFITTNDKGEIITDSTLFNATRDYNLPEAPHTSFGPAPPAETKTVDLGNEVTEYLVISYWTTTNEFGGLITTSSTRTVRLLLTAHCSMLRVTTTCLRLRTSFGPAPPAETKTVDLGNEVTEYLVISYWTTTNEFGGLITTSSTRTVRLLLTAHCSMLRVTTTCLRLRTSFGPAPPAETKTVDLGNEVTEYLVISYWTTTNEFGGLITTSSTRTYSPPPVTITATTAADYVETDWISFFITTNDKGEIITDSTLFNATRDYNLPEAPHTSFGPAPPAETKTVDLGNEVTEYLVISYWTTTNEFGGLITTSSTRTYSPPPVTITATTAADYVETDWISFFITTNDKGEIITDSTLFNATRDYNLPEAPHTSFGPAPPAETKTVDLGNEVTEYLVISYWTTTNEFGGLITTSSTRTYSPPPVTITATTAADYVETDWISFFITTNDKGEIITDSTLFNATRDYNLPEAPHTSFGPAPPAETKTVDLGNEVTEYLVISYWTTTNEFGGLITTSSTRTYSPPPVTITATTAADYVETDWISFFITTNDKGEIITDSTLFNATRDYNLPEAPHTFGPAPPAETKTVDLGNEVTEYLVISYWTTTNEFGGLITTSSTRTYSPPPVTITATTAADYVETDWISFFITTNDKGEIITDSTLFNATRDYNLPEAPHTSFGPAPPAETKTVDLGNEVTEYLVISYWTTTNEFGGLITTSSTRTYSPPPVTITATTAADYVETDWISFFITTNDKGEIITDSTLFNATRDYNLPEAPHTSFGPAPPAETKTVDLGNEVTEYLVISYWTTTNEFGGLITTSSTRTVRLLLTAHCSMLRVTTTCLRLRTSFGPAPPAETKTVDLGNEVTEYLVISYWTTTNEFGGLITTSSTRTYSPPPVTITATTAADYVETDWISFFITTNDKGEIITDSTLFNATRDYNLPEAPHTSFGPAPPADTKTVDLGNEVTEYLVISYWTTTNEFGGLITTSSTRTYSPPPVTITATTAADYVETDWISFFITTNDKGEIITDSTLFNATRDYNLPEAPHTSFGPAPPAETKTVDLGNEVTEYLVISYWTTTNEFGGLITTSSTRTYSPPPVTITATTAADYVETDWISFFITTNDKGEIITDSTLFNATRDYNLPEAPHTSFGPAPPAETKTVDLGNEVTEYLVISYWTTTNEFGGLITTSSTRTYSPPPVTITATTAADYVETDWISFFITTNDKGEIITDSTLFNATREYIDAEAPHLSSSMKDVLPESEADYTTTIDKGNGEFETDLVSHITTKDSDGKPTTITTTIPLKPSEVGEAGEADYTTTIISDGHTITEVVSHVTTTDSDGKTITYITTMASYDQVDEGVFTSAAPYSQPPVVTSTITEDDGSSKTVVISYFPSEGEDGVTRTGTTTVSTITPGEADYTTTIISDGHTITEVVSHVTTTDSDGKTITYITTMASYDQVDEGVFTSAAPYSQPPVVTSTITEDDGSSKTVVISYFPSEGEDGVTRTGTTTVSTITPGEADYTTTIISDGHTITEVVSHVTTTDSDGKTITYITTMASYDQVDEGVFTSAAPYSQPPVVTSTITEDDGSSKTVVISYFPSEGEDGVTRTGTTTVSTITPGEADYTTTIISDGHTITEVVSHVTTTDSDGKTITYTTTIFSNDWLLVDSELDVKSNHPTSVVSKENPYTTVDSQSTISSNSGNTVVTTKTPANGNENHGLSSVNGTSVSSGRNTIPSVSLIITNTLGFAGPINKPSYSTTSASSSVPQEVARDSSKYGENVSSVGIMLPQMSKPHASSASISVVHSSSRPVISRGSRPSDVSARPTENTPTFGSMPVQSGAENDASVSSTNDNQNTHTAQSRLQQLGKTSSDLGTTALLIPSSSAVNISHTGGPSDTQIASVLQGSGFKIKANKSEVMILLVTVFLFLGMV